MSMRTFGPESLSHGRGWTVTTKAIQIAEEAAQEIIDALDPSYTQDLMNAIPAQLGQIFRAVTQEQDGIPTPADLALILGFAQLYRQLSYTICPHRLLGADCAICNHHFVEKGFDTKADEDERLEE
jgi:hypothetical protein